MQDQQKPVPIDEYIAADLVEWYRQTPYHAPTDWVFATDSNRAGAKRGEQPLWLRKIMGYHVQPTARKLGITKRIGWHTFRRTYSSILQDNGEDVKVVQRVVASCLNQSDIGCLCAGANARQSEQRNAKSSR